ncbi:MAG: DNA alkylation repair protein [Cyanobacteria bacterium P01_G01_bin.4]
MNPTQLSKQIMEELKALGRGSRQEHRPSAQRDFGVYTADLRGVVRRHKQSLKSQDAEFVLSLAHSLIDQNVSECRHVAYELIAAHSAARETLDQPTVESLGRGIDNWACVDTFCAYVAGAAWRAGHVPDDMFDSWAASEDLWWRRAAVVSTVALNTKSRGGTGDKVRTLRMCEKLVLDPEIMVQKAISWALRELVPWDRDAVEHFLLAHQETVSARVRREVRRKLDTGKKN